MTGIIKEEILTTVRKKRFILLTLILFIGAVFMTVSTKNKHWNDLTFFLAMQNYVKNYFDPFMGAILIFSVWRRRYTRSSIEQAESHGVKRASAVFARAAAGSIILFFCYALMALFMVILSLVFRAGSTPTQAADLLLRLGTDLIAAITIYVGSLFWLYLFAFPVVPIAVYVASILAAPVFFAVVFD